MKKPDLMIFDFDGTLVSTGQDIANSVNNTLKTMGLGEKKPDDILSCVGDGVTKLMERVLGEANRHRLDEALALFSEDYERHLLDHTALYPGVEEVLLHFADTQKIILTNKRYRFASVIAEGLGIDQYFAEIVGADSTPYMKPDQKLIEYLLEKYKARRENSVMIGDGTNDILAAKNSGIMSIAYLNGLGDRKTLLDMNADYYCEEMKEIIGLLGKSCTGK